MSFPKWMYHATTEEPLLVQSAEHESALPEGWADSPGVAMELAKSELEAPTEPAAPAPRSSKSKVQRGIKA